MERDIPKEFHEEYRKRRASFDQALGDIKALIQLRLGQLATGTGVRGRIMDARVKRPHKIWAHAKKKEGLSPSKAFTRIEDLLGIRIVCNNLSDIGPIVEMLRNLSLNLTVVEVKIILAVIAE